MCRVKLVVERTSADAESVIGEECHIISAAPNGPRYDSAFPSDKINEIENLILLCASHHKTVDDQFETFTVEVVRGIKRNHESWVEKRLSENPTLKPVGIRRSKDGTPQHLNLVLSAKELWSLMSRSKAFAFDHPSDLASNETELVGEFLQEIRDWGDLGLESEPIEQVRAVARIQEMIKTLAGDRLLVYANIESARLEGGTAPPSSFGILHLHVVRSESNAANREQS